MITNKFDALSPWPVNGILVTLLLDKSCKCQMIHNQMTLKSINMEFFSCGFLQCEQNAVPHICLILLVLRHLASLLWMYTIIINIHDTHLIHDGSMAPYDIHNTKQQLFSYEQPSRNKTLCNGLECMKL
jgi:hypothetical protein